MIEEPEIIINGVNIGPGCAMTIRVAIEVFYSNLQLYRTADLELNNLYMQRINDIRRLMWVIK